MRTGSCRRNFSRTATEQEKKIVAYSNIYIGVDKMYEMYEYLGERGPHAYFKAFAERTIEKGEMKLFLTDGRGQEDNRNEFIYLADAFTHVFRCHGSQVKDTAYPLIITEVMGRVDAIRKANIGEK